MDGHRRWILLIVASLAVFGAIGVVAIQLELSGAKEHPCGTALRIDRRAPTTLRLRAQELQSANDDLDPATAPTDGELLAEALLAEADELDDRCKGRQRLALLGLGAGGAIAVAAIALSTYRLGHRAGSRAGSSTA